MKYVPDAMGKRRFIDDLTTGRESVDALLPELDEYAVEQALRIGEAAGDSQVTVLTVGPEAAKDAVRKARSTRFSQLDEVGVKCRWNRGCRSSHSLTLGGLPVA
ncbi:electron transfer flavoprotein [Saccharopolyspora spinosa]|uniref:Electron transfer flavoprotein n=1 Tax=Saccharopolyspora spinosa TaxID=60894 RepID=A0A2N3Y6H4_SACSN|nr:electron transfer flavoprotein [Saccharopolyspora spinosa]